MQANVLHNVSFSIDEGEIMAIVDTSDFGKNILPHLPDGLDTSTSGNVIFSNQPVSKLSTAVRANLRNRELSFIYQFHYLLPDSSALENVAMPLLTGKKKLTDIECQAKVMPQAVEFERRSHHRLSELSNGKCQRVATARALVNKPRLVLVDEPTSDLDARNADSTLQLLDELNVTQRTALLVMTHDLQLAKRMSHQLEMCDGRLTADLTLMETEQWRLRYRYWLHYVPAVDGGVAAWCR